MSEADDIRPEGTKDRHSERAELAQRIASFICNSDLAQVFGGDAAKVNPAGKRPYYSVGFSKRCNLDGTVAVYGPRFIRIDWETRFHHLPRRGGLVFESETDALKFLRLAFVDLSPAALDVPSKPTGGRHA